MHFLIEIIMVILKSIKSHFKGAYDKQNLTRVVILYEIYETSLPLFPASNAVYGASCVFMSIGFICLQHLFQNYWHIHVVPFLPEKTFMWIPVCFPIQRSLQKMVSILNLKDKFSRGVNSEFLELPPLRREINMKTTELLPFM